MRNKLVAISCVIGCVLVCVFVLSPLVAIGSPICETEQTIWELENSYWRDVQENNLTAYRRVWHKDFLGWPSVSEAPVHKDHITDWITSQTSKGLSFKLIAFKPAAIQASGELVVACYRITSKWVDKDGMGTERTVRITHTWIKTGKDWQIVGGMSMPEPANPPR
jgi:hypothetical protein